MFKKLFLMLALVSSAGLIAAEGEDDTSAVFADEIEQPGKVKRAVNFLTKNWMVTAPAAVLAFFASITTLRNSSYGYSKKGWLNTAYYGLRHPFMAAKSDWKDLTCPGKVKVAKLKADADALVAVNSDLDKACHNETDALVKELKKPATASPAPDVAKVKGELVTAIDALTFKADGTVNADGSPVDADKTKAGIADLKAKLTEFEAKFAKHAKAVADKTDRDNAIQAFNDLNGW